MRTLLTLVAALATLGFAGCAPAANSSPHSDLVVPSAEEEQTVIQVKNYNLNNVDVFLVRSGMRHRLGSLGTHQSRTYRVPRSVIAEAEQVRLVADPVGPTTEFTQQRSSPYITEPLMVPEGQAVVFTIENNLAASRYTLASR